MLDVFRFDPNFDENELLWEQIKKEILGDDDDEDEEEEGEGEDGEGGGQGSASCVAQCSHFSKINLLTFT
jgi:pre-mRNA-splicing factor CWC22